MQETPEEMCWRVALSIARAEERYGRSRAAMQEVAAAFYDLMVDGYSRVLSDVLEKALEADAAERPARAAPGETPR